MNFETEKVIVPLWLLMLFGLLAVTAVMGAWYYWLDDQSAKMIGLVGGIVSALVVFSLTFVTTVRPIQQLDRYRRMGIRAVLRNRHDKEYYRKIVANAKKDVRVMGASCTRFIEDFLDVKSDDRVLVTALRINSALRVQLLAPQEQYMAESAKARSQEVSKLLDLLKREFGDRIEMRRFAERAAHSLVIVDDDLVAGPIFEGDKSKYAPAVHVAMWTDFARKYSEHFDEVCNAVSLPMKSLSNCPPEPTRLPTRYARNLADFGGLV
jgi:hypothetical protein